MQKFKLYYRPLLMLLVIWSICSAKAQIPCNGIYAKLNEITTTDSLLPKGHLIISWNICEGEKANIKGIIIEGGTSMVHMKRLSDTLPITEKTFIDTSKKEAYKTYYYRARILKDNISFPLYSNRVKYNYKYSPPLPTPQNLKAVLVKIDGQDYFKLTWDTVNVSIKGYHVYSWSKLSKAYVGEHQLSLEKAEYLYKIEYQVSKKINFAVGVRGLNYKFGPYSDSIVVTTPSKFLSIVNLIR